MKSLLPHISDERRRAIAWWLLGFTALWILVLAAFAVRLFLRDGATGDFEHYYWAAKAVTEGQNPYQQHIRQFGYLPLWAIVQTVLVPLGPGWAGAVWVACNTVFIGVALWVGSGEILKRLGAGADLLLRACVIAAAAAVMSDKIRAELRLGQTDAVILVSFILALKWLQRWPWASGVLLGFVANFKFQSLVMVPYFVVRRRWAALASTVVWTVAFALCGALIWGWEKNREYLSIALGSLLEMVGIARDIADGPALFPLSWGRSVSVPSLLARIAESQGWSVGRVVVLGVGLLACAAVGAAWWMYARRGADLFAGRSGRADDASERGRLLVLLEWAGLITGALAFSPQTTVRHLYLMLFVVMTCAGVAFSTESRVVRRAMVGMLVLFWAGMTFPPGGLSSIDDEWKWIGGPVLVSLGLFFVTLWFGLGGSRRAAVGSRANG